MQLRKYQTEAILKIGAVMNTGKKRVVLYAPTGAGKTCIGLEVIRRAIALEKKIIFVCNRIELVGQTSRKLAQYGIAHDIIQGSNTVVTDEPVKVCSIQTMDRRGYPDADVCIVDEAHGTAGSTAYHRFMEHYKEKLIVGLTATPFAKGMSKEYAWGTLWEGMAVASTIRELITEGHLVDCEIFAPSEPDLSKVKIVAGDYNETQLGEAVDKQELIGDIVTHWQRLGYDKPTVCFATNISHSRHIVESFKAVGVTAEHLDCYTPEDERRAILNRVSSGDTKIISNVSVLAEGWDCPIVEVMILARPTRSLTRYIQMAGRILRPFSGKTIGRILDHSGSCRRLGFPTDDLPLILDDGKPRTAQEKKKEERKLEERAPVICAKCSAVLVKITSTCPRCGTALPRRKNTIETIDGELVKVVKRKGKLLEMPNADKAKTYSELLGYARETGKRDGWAWYACRDLFGSAPRERMPAATPSPETRKLIQYLNIRKANARRAFTQP